MLSVRVVTVDYYISRPIKELDYTCRSVRTNYWNEPVIRIFGPTSDGIKTCINIHGVYPYIYVPYRGGDNPERDALLLGAALDQALAMNTNSKNSKFVYKVVLTSGIPLYGYHSRPRQFLKIYFFNPVHVKKASDLLLSGAILGQRLQPHEAHIPYTLQFMIDYNIHGMSFVTVDRVKYRMSPTDPDSLKGIDKAHILPTYVKRTSHSYWEVDVLAEDIANRRERGGASVNPGLEAIWEDEKCRRRARDKTSQITPQISQSRGEMKITANELMHKQRLAQKLRDVVPEEKVPTEGLPEDEPSLSYPAEVPDDVANILEASAVDASGGDPPADDLLEDVKDLVDEKILTQLSLGSGNEETESEDEQERAVDDSILGRNRRDDGEAEPDDEDGGDMTQPLEMLESVIHGDCLSDRDGRGIDYCDSEDEFWKEMANKIMQLDGTDDLSSLDSDEEIKKSVGGTRHGDELNKTNAAVDRILGTGSPGNESAWSSNIMSILNEDSSFSAQQISYQTPQTFWSNWSPRMTQTELLWTPQSDSWSWDKSEASILDCLSYGSKKDKIGEEVSFPRAEEDPFRARTASETVPSGDFYGFPVASQGEYFQGNFTPTSTMSPTSNVGSVYNISPPSTILTPSSEIDNYSDINLDSVCETTSQISNSPSPQEDAKSVSSEFCARGQIMESKTVTVPKNDSKATVLKADHKDLLALLRNFSKSCKSVEKTDGRLKMLSLVLKQYIKTCGEILNVDFKSLSGKEMIVVEYRPINSKSNQNKFLIKPLDKFLEDWNSVEKLNNFQERMADEQTDWPKYINGFADTRENAEEEKQLSAILKTLENKYTGSWLNESRIKSIKNKFIVKSIEMIPDESSEKLVKNELDKTYKVNENVVSEGKIKMKLIKDRKERKTQKDRRVGFPESLATCAGPENSCAEKNESVGQNNVRSSKKIQAKFPSQQEVECLRQKDRNAKKPKSDKGGLIDQINKSFENYFKKIAKESAKSSRNETPGENSVEEESTSGEEGNENPDCESESETESASTGSSEAVKFITQILSALTSMSRSTSMPPLSITINLGNCRNSPSVHFNFQSGRNLSQKKKRSEKLLINNVDGPADTSSSEDLGDGKDFPRTPNRKRQKKDLGCAASSIAVQKQRDPDTDRKKRKLPFARNLADDLIASRATSSGVSSFNRRGRRRKRRGAEASKNHQEKRNEPNVESGTEQKIETENLTRFEEGSGSSRQLARFNKDLVNKIDSSALTNESDFIGDSENENFERSKRKKRRKKVLRKSKKTYLENFNVPQTDVVSSSESDDTLSFISKALRRLKKVVSESEETSKSRASDDRILSPKQAEEEIGEIVNFAPAEVSAMENDMMRVDEPTNENDASDMPQTQEISISSETVNDRHSSSNLGRELFSPSQDLPPFTKSSSLCDIAVNSDDSLKAEESFEADRDVSPFELSGPLLHNRTLTDSSPVSLPRSGIGSPDKLSSERRDFLSVTPSSEGVVQISDRPVVETLTGLLTITPKTKPPSFLEVKETLKDFAIPDVIAQVPFYSDSRDISKSMEVGGKVLKIENYSVAGLKTHVSALNLFGVEALRKRILNLQERENRSIRSALVGKREVTIIPIFKPPSRCEVFKFEPKKIENSKRRESAKARITVPKSPGQNSDSSAEDELSVTLGSPCTEKKGSRTSTLESEDSPDPSSSKAQGKVSFEGSSASNSPTYPESLRCSTPYGSKLFCPSPRSSKKDFRSRAKGIKRMSLTTKLETIAEGRQLQVREANKKADPIEERKYRSESSFEIRGVTPDNTYGFKSSVDCLQKAKAIPAHELITMLVMELHIRTRGTLRPDPQHDPMRAVFFTVFTDAPGERPRTEIVAVGDGILHGTAAPSRTVYYVPDEIALMDKVIELLRVWDPDILAGYEIEMHSWGYLFQRSLVLEKNIFPSAGRVIDDSRKWKQQIAEAGEKEFDDVPRYLRHMRVTGRIVLDIWRLLRHEVSLTSYTFENVMYHLMHERHPRHSYRLLSHFWEHPTRRYRHITVEYYVTRVEGVVRLLEQLDFIGCNSELARLFGIQFFEVFSRGSQFRVESMMLRLAKPLNYVPCSPSIRQRASMRAPASLPLIMEPESMFYADPVIVLDFQSLYPSMITAYNYCFSTCLGRVEMLGREEPFEFGCTHLQISPEELKKLENDIHISPAGVAFVRSNVRKGVLPSMLEEILATRLMVKRSMKDYKGDRILQKVLHARQLGLKLIANVTYGYTAANFSGRMPSIEVGDSIVSKGRETLQRAIEMVKNTPKWGAKVVYGDTDSLFLLTPGKTRKEAFRIGSEIAEAVTLDNPKPVKLKLEKVYQPSILQTKKRYVGYMYESPDQEEPVYDAKGIETVRRDGCPATAKILQKALEILFDTSDVSLVKKYALRQFAKLFQGRVNIQDLTFAKEYRGRHGYRPGACVPALQLAKQWTLADRRAEPRVKERVPYVIVNGPPGLPLIRLVRSPHDLFADPNLRINAVYYITKAIIPPMQRCFSLLGADVSAWYAEMPRRYHKVAKATWTSEAQKKVTISQYFASVDCAICSETTTAPVCDKCRGDDQKVAAVFGEKMRILERRRDAIAKICGSCCGRTTTTDCESLDCPVLYRRHQALRDSEQVAVLRRLSDELLA